VTSSWSFSLQLLCDVFSIMTFAIPVHLFKVRLRPIGWTWSLVDFVLHEVGCRKLLVYEIMGVYVY